MGSGASTGVRAGISAASDDHLRVLVQSLYIENREKLERALAACQERHETRFVSAEELAHALCAASGNILDDIELLQMLEAFRGSDCSESFKVLLLSKLNDLEKMLDPLGGELGQLGSVLNTTVAEMMEVKGLIEAEVKKRSTALEALKSEFFSESKQAENPDTKQTSEEAREMQNLLDQSLSQFDTVQSKLQELTNASDLARSRLQICIRMQNALRKAPQYLKDCYAVTVATDCSSTMVTCLNLAGEELIPALPIDVNYGTLRQAVQAVAPDAYVRLMALNGTVLREAAPGSELVKNMLEHASAS